MQRTHTTTRRHRQRNALEFWDNVRRTRKCWEWIGVGNGTGYGLFQRGGRRTLAHRYAYEEEYGRIPDGMFVCHHCDNTRCVRPSHLFVGTHADNMRDCVEKGRRGGARGPYKPQLRTGAVAENITRLRIAAGLTQADVEAATGISNLAMLETQARNPRLPTLSRVAGFFGVTVSDLFREPKKPRRKRSA